MSQIGNNAVIKFVDTNYAMSFTWNVECLKDIILVAANSVRTPTITCSNRRQSGIAFHSVESLLIQNLYFNHCGNIVNLVDLRNNKFVSRVLPALYINGGKDLVLRNLKISGAESIGFTIANAIGDVLVCNMLTFDTEVIDQSVQIGSIIMYTLKNTDSRICVNIIDLNLLVMVVEKFQLPKMERIASY